MKMEKEKTNNITLEEIREMIKEVLKDNKKKDNDHLNRVDVGDIVVQSNVESLETCKNFANELISKNHRFLELRKNKITADQTPSYLH